MKFHTSKFRAYVENSPVIYRSHVHAENWEYYKRIRPRNEHGTKRDIGRGERDQWWVSFGVHS